MTLEFIVLEEKVKKAVPKPKDEHQAVYDSHILMSVIQFSGAAYSHLKHEQRVRIIADYLSAKYNYQTIYDAGTQAKGNPEREDQRNGLDSLY